MKYPKMPRLLIPVCLIVGFTLPLYGGADKGDFGIGLNYPGFGARYFLSDSFSLELRGQREADILVAGLRGYYYFFRSPDFLMFTGLEGDYAAFKGEASEGSGFAGEVFAGGEYFFAKSLSLQLDFGPAFIALNDRNVPESVSGLEYVVNLGVNFYF